ncbi:MAG: macrolide family glycosyltransferase [Pseudomonadota bacterium]|nr:macrolide family glycosyltransferase [Pseudomonadota bacterium]
MGKAVFFNLPGAVGHINPSLGLVSELVKRGEQVIYYAGEDSRSAIESRGAVFRNYQPYFDYHHNAQAAAELIGAAFTLLELAEASVVGLAKQLDDDKPDYIIYDSCCLYGKYLAQRLGVPGICIITTVVSTPLLLIADLPLGAHVAKELVLAVPKVVEARRRLMDMLASVGLPYRNIVHHAFDIFANEGDLNIVFLSPKYQPFSNRLKPNYKLVGASIPEGRDNVDLNLPNTVGERLVYISLGTVHNMRADFYRQCLKAFEGAPYHVVMSVGRNTDVDDLGEIPSNFTVRNRVPQLEVLKRADAFVTHAGMNSINESLYFNVPMVMVPQQVEQEFNARRVRKNGAGVVLPRHKVSVKSLRQSVDGLLQEPQYAKNAEAFGESLRAAGGYRRAAAEILEFVGENDNSSLRKLA